MGNVPSLFYHAFDRYQSLVPLWVTLFVFFLGWGVIDIWRLHLKRKVENKSKEKEGGLSFDEMLLHAVNNPQIPAALCFFFAALMGKYNQ